MNGHLELNKYRRLGPHQKKTNALEVEDDLREIVE
jgi:hypothetical protein